jgi:outer membrane protein TolC
MSTRLSKILLVLCLSAGGCTQYRAMPLSQPAVERSLAAPAPNDLRVEARSIKHPLLKPVPFVDMQGLTPDQAAVLAVLANPSLRAARDERNIAAAQLLQAGILPNPQLSFGEDYPYGGALQGAVTASAVGLNWDVTQLISHDAKIRAAQAQSASIDLSVAWQEWQTAQAAKTAVYDLASVRSQLALAKEIDSHLAQNLSVIRQAVDQHERTLLDLSAAEAASVDAHAAVLNQQHDEEDQRLALNKALGLAPDAIVTIDPGIVLPDSVAVPSAAELLAGLEDRRLDLLALRLGYQNQEQTLRAAVLEQFPKINIGFNRQRDDTNVQSVGFAVTLDLPIFDRNQGTIAAETATRQKLFDEYVQRVFEARYDVFTALDDLNSISAQIAAAENVVPSLQRLSDFYREALNRGNVDVLSYYTAVNNLAQKQLDILKLKQELMDNVVALELATGEYMPASAAAEKK